MLLAQVVLPLAIGTAALAAIDVILGGFVRFYLLVAIAALFAVGAADAGLEPVGRIASTSEE